MTKPNTHSPDMFKGKEVLITGGLGFIGSNLARELVKRGANVTIVDSLIPEFGGNLFNIRGIEKRLRVNLSDVRSPHTLPLFVEGKDYLFNLAGQTSHLDSMHDPQADLEINCRAQLSILECCRLVNPAIKIVFAGTRQIYGRPDRVPVDESHPIRPVDINGIHKAAAENYHLLYHQVYGLHTSVLRLTNTIGPRMRIKDARQTFVGVWIRHLIEGRPIEVWGGEQMRDFTYVDDAVAALLLAAGRREAAGKAFNLGGTSAISLGDLARLAVAVNGGGNFVVKAFPADRKRIDVGDYFADFSRIRSELGWAPKVDVREALRRTIVYFKKNYDHYV